MIYDIIGLNGLAWHCREKPDLLTETTDNLAENFSYLNDSNINPILTDVFVRFPIMGMVKRNESNELRKYLILDMDYEAYRFFDSIFSKYRHKFTTISFNGVTYKSIKSANFYGLEITPKTAKDVEWFLSRFIVNISEEAKKIIHDEARKYDASQEEIRCICAGKIKIDKKSLCTELIVGPQMEEKPFQQEFLTLLYKKKRILNADCMGGGKSWQAAMVGLLPNSLPALIVVPKQIDIQWYKAITGKFFTNAKAQIITKGDFAKKIKEDTHFFIVSYSLLNKVQEIFKARGIEIKSLIGDEIEQIRNLDTDKSQSFGDISETVNYSIGLSGTPIGKEGFTIWSILHRINKENSLGSSQLFREQFCDFENNAKNPQELREYLIKNGDMVSRTKEQVGLGGVEKIIKSIPIHGSISDLNHNNDILKNLAMSILSLDVTKDSDLSEFDFRLREATGIAKARSVAQMARIYIEAGRKIIITGWYRGFWDILEEELGKYNPVYITGTEIGNQKNKSKEEFISNPNVKVLFLSHLSGAGIDGLEEVCYTIIHGELAWLVKDHEQLDARLIRYGQKEMVEVFYPYIEDGSDPLIRRMHARQRIQLNGIMGGKAFVFDEDNDDVNLKMSYEEERFSALKEIARNILKNSNIDFFEGVKFTPSHTRVSNVLKKIKVSTKDEKFLQEQLFEVLIRELPDMKVEREFRISKRSILDFKITSENGETIIIECKTTDRGKKSAHKQVERYIEELNHNSTIIFAPWMGVKDFYIGDHQVEILNYTDNP